MKESKLNWIGVLDSFALLICGLVAVDMFVPVPFNYFGIFVVVASSLWVLWALTLRRH